MTTAVSARMRVNQASEEYGIPAATLRHWRATGRGPKSYNIGRSVYYDRADVEAWLEAQRANAIGDEL